MVRTDAIEEEAHAGDPDRERLLALLRAGAPAAGARPERIRFAGRQAVVKRRAPSAGERVLRRLGRPGRIARSARVGRALRDAGVRVPRLLASVEEPLREGGRGLLVLEAVEGLDLRRFLLSRFAAAPDATARGALGESLWSAVAREVARLHAVPARQRDLKAANIVIEETAGGLAAWLIDLDGMSLLPRPPSGRLRVRDLARLAVSLREEAVRAAGVGPEDWSFLVRRYLEESAGRPPAPREVDSFVEDTLAWARAKEARNRRRGRVIE
jgi:tRNA A-37 threonylcarbamoyl transferase component Bud32